MDLWAQQLLMVIGTSFNLWMTILECWAYFLKQKPKVFKAFKSFNVMTKVKSGYLMKKLRSDNGTK